MQFEKLAGFHCASTTFQGRLAGIFADGYQPLIEQIRSAGHIFTGESREIYHEWFGPDSEDNVIEIQFGIEMKS
ncbi:hypothetical protein [Gynuella sunshinyii]|uniref:GyrI-like small molecule binding domain-containing protein n=1 Tax=Gynuella sunshinyii YC6258 TaxID=1445510 RepID=A0A0C5VR27_9GAMM|nr:hypothetical protein [Gynuella sunshinyii]AJQ97087.1 hypothetical Protein YC6258_05057 [Gynuella sunshinyii YC6258]